MMRTLILNAVGRYAAWWLALALGLLAGPGAWGQAPAWQSAMNVGDRFTNTPPLTTTDANGNVYLTGRFGSSASFSGITLTSAGGYDVYVAKWSPAANRFVWAVRGGGTGNELPYAIAVVGSNVYVTGGFAGAQSLFGNVTLQSHDTNPQNASHISEEIFISKLTDTGSSASFTWAQSAGATPPGGSSSAQYAYGLAVSGGSVYLAGEVGYYGVRFGGITLPGGVDRTVFVAKLTDMGNSGSFVWAQQAGGDHSSASCLAVSGTAVYLAGYFTSGTATFGAATIANADQSGTGNPQTNGQNSADIFVAKLTDAGSSGSFTWATRAGGTKADFARALVASGSALYLAGDFASATASFGAASVTNTSTSGSSDVFVAKLTDSGSAPAVSWARSGGGPSSDYGQCLALSGSRVYLAGSFSGTATLGVNMLTGAGSLDIFVTRLTDAGSATSFDWAQQASSPDYEQPSGLAVLGTNTVYLAGSFNGSSLSFGSTTLTSSSGGPCFLASLVDGAPVPTLTAVSPGTAAAGATLTLTGTNLAGTTAITFTGVANNVVTSGFTVNSAGTQLTGVVVPAGATTGSITATTAVAISQPLSFTVVPPPTLVSLSATVGAVGSTLTLTGTSLTGVTAITFAGTANNVVTSGFTVNSNGTQLTGVVVPAGATTGLLTATAYGGVSNGLTFTVTPPAPAWQAAVASSGSDLLVQAIATDNGGNVYLAGNFLNTVTLGSTTLTSAGSYDAFVAKWSSVTGAFVWARAMGGTSTEQVAGVAVSGTTIYVAGSFASSSASFGGTTLLNAGRGGDVFVVRLTDAGNTSSFNWAQRAGGANDEVVNALALNGPALYVAGSFTYTATFGSSTLTAGSSPVAFVARLTDTGTAGSVDWGQQPTGGGSDSAVRALAVSGGSVYLSGLFSYNISFGSTTLTTADFDMFVAKLTDTGSSASFTWALGGSNPAGQKGATALAVSGNGVYVGGYFYTAPVTYGTTLTRAGGYIAKITDAGSTASFTWAQSLGSASSFNVQVKALATLGSAVYTVGYFDPNGSTDHTLLFGNDVSYTSASLGGSGSKDMFLTKLTDAGSTSSFEWAQGTSSASYAQANAVAVSSSSDVYVVGQGYLPLRFGTITLAGTGSSSVGFLASLSASLLPTITSFAPTTGPPGTTVVISGTNLAAATAVSFNGTAATGLTSTSSGTQVSVVVPAGATTGPISISTPAGMASSSTSFTVTPPPPVITSFTPAFAKSGQTIVINGSGLDGATSLTFSGVSQSSFTINAAGTQLTAQVPYTGNPTYPALTSGTVRVTTTVGAASSATPLRLLAISSAVTAADGNPFGLMAQSVSITGSGFGGGTAQFGLAYPSLVTFPVAYTVVDETHITATVPDVSGTTARDGHGAWLVTNTPGTVNANYELLSPVVTSIAPANAPAGTVVTVTGFNFVHNDIRPASSHYNQLSTITGFDFNNTPGTSFQLVGPTGSYAQYQAKITVPAGLSGPVYVQATGGYLQGGGQIQGYYFGGAAVPTLTGSSASSGPAGSTLTLTGTGLSGTSVITFAGTANNTVTTGFTVNMAGTQLTGVVVPSGATTGSITATTPGGTTNGLAFTVTYPDLIVSTGTLASPTAVAAGTYNSITVASGGVAQLAGSTTAIASIAVNGTLLTNCQPLTGAASFTLAAGATLGICDPLGLSSAAGQGAVQTTGTRTFSTDASYLYNGSATQVTGSALPSQVRNLSTLNNTTVTLTAPVAVAQVVTVAGAGNLVLNGQSLTLLSSAAGTALVVNSGTGVVQGPTGTMQRYLDASGNTGPSGYRHYSSPVSGATVAGLATTGTGGSFVPVVNPAYNTSAVPTSVSPYPTVYGYDESRLATSPATNLSAFDKGYLSPATPSDPLRVGQGYTVQIGNNELVGFTGTFTTGTVTLANLTRGTAAEAGWQLVGNPYPAPLDWGTVGAAGTGGSGLNGLDAAAYVFQSTGPYVGRYRSFVNGIGAGTGVLAAGQGFFIRTSVPGQPGTLTLTNANRLTSYGSGQPAVQRTADTRPRLRLSLGLGTRAATPATAQDEAFVYFEAGATAGYDGQFDAHKLPNPSGYYLATATPGSSPLGLSVDGRAPLAAGPAEEVIPMWLSVPAGSYSLTASELVNFDRLAGGTAVYLRDGLTGTLTDLSQQPSVAFSVAAGAASSGRFALVFHPAAVLATAAGQLPVQVSLYPNPAQSGSAALLTVTALPTNAAEVEGLLLDVLGRRIGQYRLPARNTAVQSSLPTGDLPAGVYLLRLTARTSQGQVISPLPTQRLVVR